MAEKNYLALTYAHMVSRKNVSEAIIIMVFVALLVFAVLLATR